MARESYRRGVSGENAPGVGSEGRRRTSSFPAHPSIGKSWVGRPMDRQGIRERVNQRTRRSVGAGSARTVRPDRMRCTQSAGGHGRVRSDVTDVFTGAAHGVGTTGTAETGHRTGSHHRHLEDPGHRCAWPPVRSKPDQILSVRTTRCLIGDFLSPRVLDTRRCRSRIKSRSNPASAPTHAQNGMYPDLGRAGSATRISCSSRAWRMTCEIWAAFRLSTPKRSRKVLFFMRFPLR